MEKVIIIGSPGAGKSTFARKLKDVLNLPLYHLDLLWHKPDRTTISKNEFDARLVEIMKEDRWLIDGNYMRTMEMRLKECDTVFLLDFPVEICLDGAKSRVGQIHDDLPWMENEFDEEFKQFIADFPKDTLPKIYQLLKKYQEDVTIYVLKSREDMKKYLKERIKE